MTFLNGWKTVIGFVVAVAACLLSHGFSLGALADCIKQIASGQTAVGAGLGIAALGLAHKAYKLKTGHP